MRGSRRCCSELKLVKMRCVAAFVANGKEQQQPIDVQPSLEPSSAQ